jgi:predicted butyrate kinase (DUF1464 family)
LVGWLISLVGLPEAVPWDIAVIVTAGTLNDGASTTTGYCIGFLDNALAIIFATQLISQLLHWLVN